MVRVNDYFPISCYENCVYCGKEVRRDETGYGYSRNEYTKLEDYEVVIGRLVCSNCVPDIEHFIAKGIKKNPK